jgi:hypothetical protein
MANLPENSGITKMVYPLDYMMENKTAGLLYWKNDVHWNDLGAYYGWKPLEAEIKKQLPSLVPAEPSSYKTDALRQRGDMNKDNPAIPDDKKTKYKLPVASEIPSTTRPNPNVKGHSIITYKNPKGSGRTLLIGTSMMPYAEPFMANAFGELVSIRQTQAIVSEYMPLMKNADIIILNMHERNLQSPLQLPTEMQ